MFKKSVKATSKASVAIRRVISFVLCVMLSVNVILSSGGAAALEFERQQNEYDRILNADLSNANPLPPRDSGNNVVDEQNSNLNIVKSDSQLRSEYATNLSIEESVLETTRYIIKFKTDNNSFERIVSDPNIKSVESVKSINTAAERSNGELLRSGVFNNERVAVSDNRIKVIETNSTMTKNDFENVVAALGITGEIEYIQPDYLMAISAEITPEEFINGEHADLEDDTDTNTEPDVIDDPNTSDDDSNGDDITELDPDDITEDDFEDEDTDDSNDEEMEDDENIVENEFTIVALLDSGVDVQHPELASYIYYNTREIPDNGIDDDGNGFVDDFSGWDFFNNDNSVNDYDTYYDQWHGTHVAGIIAGESNVKILPIKIFEGGYAYTSEIIAAIAYAESMGAIIINCSWGNRFENPALREAIENSNMLFVCATGNDLYNIDNFPVYPAAYSPELDNVIAVASIDESGKLSRFSNYGVATVDIAAPGQNILSTWINGEYVGLSGTSMSAGYVSGAAALVLSQYPNYSSGALKQHLILSADTITGLEDKISGGKSLNCDYAISGNGINYNVIDIPDNEALPINVPNTPPVEDDFALYGAEYNMSYRSSMSAGRHGLQVVELGGYIYAIGGQTTATAGYTNLVEKYNPATDTWSTVKSMNYPRSYFGSVVYGGKIYAFGGASTNGALTNSIEVYDPSTNLWTTIAAVLPVAMKGLTATLIDGTNLVYILGGFTTTMCNTVYRFNLTTNAVSAMASLPVAISNHNAFYFNGNVCINGGKTSSGISTKEYQYNVSSSTTNGTQTGRVWLADSSNIITSERYIAFGGASSSAQYTTSMSHSLLQERTGGLGTNMLTARAGHGTVFYDGKVYVVGGINGSGVLSSIELMDLGWVDKAPMPVSLKNYNAVSLGDKIYVVGGEQLINGSAVKSNKVYEYNAITNTWSTKQNVTPIYPSEFGLTEAFGKIYLIGGLYADTASGGYYYSNKIYEYNPENDTWIHVNNLSVARGYLHSVFYDGKIYITGGWNGAGMTTVEAFDPLANTLTVKNNMPTGFYWHYSAVLNDELYVLAGYATLIKYNKVSDTWMAMNPAGNLTGNLYVPINDSLYCLGYKGNNSRVPWFTRYTPKENIGTHYITFNFMGHFHRLVALNNKIYILTGADSEYSSTLAEYTPRVSAWDSRAYVSPKKDLAAVTLNETVYLAGGYVSNTYLSVLEKYSEQTNTWTALSSMTYARSELGLASANGKLYAIGGRNATAALNYVEEYNPTSNTWVTKAAIPLATTDMAIASYNNLIYIFGGKNANNGVLNTVRIYNPATNVWSTGTNMPTARFGCGAAVIDGKIYVVGGFTSTASTVAAASNAVQIYNPATNTWDTSKAQLPRALGQAGVVASDSLYVIGGFDNINEVNRVYEYSPVINEWLEWDGPNFAKFQFASAITRRGIYAIGGTAVGGGIGGNVEIALISELSVDYRHLGDSTVNLTGNLSRTYTDISFESPGFQIDISRTYNSTDTRTSLFSQGWTFGFQGKIDSSGNDIVVRLPNGAGSTFKKNSNGTFTAQDSRSTLVKNSNGTYTLTTKDMYSYGFDTNGYMNWMKDRSGNIITLTVNTSGQVTAITDQVGRIITVTYTSNRITSITDPAGRVITYTYDVNNRLSTVCDPNGYYTRYAYDTNGLLSAVSDNNNIAIETITYQAARGDRPQRVGSVTDIYGNITAYTYDDNEGLLTSIDSSGLIKKVWYDKDIFSVRTMEPDGKETRTSYNLDGGINRYGEIISHTNRNGNTTYYEYDTRGNITRLINPDGSVNVFTYDANNNMLSKKDEVGKMTYYVFDASGINLVKTAQPLNGTDVYSDGATQSNFAITTNTYYTSAEAQTQTGKAISGLLKTVTDPEGGVTTYTYDTYGNIATVKSPMNKTTTYYYNKLGWLKSVTNPRGYSTSYYYDKNGNLLKTVAPNGSVTRNIYDNRGNITQMIMPKQYLASADTAAAFNAENIQSSAATTYTQAGHGWRYTYNNVGLRISATDPLNNTTSYTYDIYGNEKTKTMPNGAIYRYTYNNLQLMEVVYFKENSTASEVTLNSYAYATLSNGTTTFSATQHFSSLSTATTTNTYDYAGRLIRVDNADGTYAQNVYNSNGTLASSRDAVGSITYYSCDGLNRVSKTWAPHGNNTYTYTGFAYNKNGNILTTTQSTSTVANGATPTSNLITTTYTYNADGLVTQTLTSGGNKTTYSYDANGNLVDQYDYSTTIDFSQTSFVYNNMDQIVTKKTYIQNRDIAGNPNTTSLVELASTYTYDINGNLLTDTNPAGVATTFTYDLLNRVLSTSQPGITETGAATTITTSQTYDWAGNIVTATDALGRVTTNTYSAQGFLAKTTNPLGGISYSEYDLAGRITASVSPKNYVASTAITNMVRTEYAYDAMSRIIQERQVYKDTSNNWQTIVSGAFTYDGNGNTLTSKDALGYEQGYSTTYQYDKANRLTQVTNALGNTSSSSYDALGRVISATDGKGNVTAFTYDSSGNVLTKRVGGVLVQTNTYDLLGNVLTTKDGKSNTTSFSYNTLGLVRTTTLPGDSTIGSYTITSKYTRLGQPAESTDSIGKQTLITYDNQGRGLTTTERKSDGSQVITATNKYDKAGNLRTQIDGRGTAVAMTYDVLGRNITKSVTVNSVVQTLTYSYDANGNVLTETDWRGNATTYTYDTLNRLVERRNPLGEIIEVLTYNKNNQQITSKDALQNTTQYQYDRIGRATVITDGAGNTQHTYYDANGNVSQTKDGNGKSTYYAYDAQNRLITVTDALGKITSYTYDAVGNMTSQTEASGHVTSTQYNTRNLPVTVTEYSRATTYTYNADGSPHTVTDPKGIVTSYTYDIHGRVLTKITGNTSVSYTYDNNGNILTDTDAQGTTVRTYDALNRLITKNVPGMGTSSYAYNVTSGMATGYWSEKDTDPKGNITTRVYNPAGRLYQVKSGSDTTTYTYQANGNRATVTYPNGIVATYTYYADNRLHTLANKLGNTFIGTYNYAYDGNGNVLTKLELAGTTTYTYDALGRLLTVTEPGASTAYTYDNAGNRSKETTTRNSKTVVTTYTYDTYNQMTQTKAVETGGGTTTTAYTYDNNGNNISRTITEPNGTAKSTQYSYDTLSRLVGVVDNAYSASYAYNTAGLRIQKSVTKNNVTTTEKFLTDGGNVVLETTANGTQVAYDVYGPEGIISRKTSADTLYYLYNGHGDVTQLTNSSGNVIIAYTYDAFGNMTTSTANDTNPFRYCGEYFDVETETYYLRARYYSPATGRFTQRDSFGGYYNDPLSLNRYTFCHNNPLKYIDPSGHVVKSKDNTNNVLSMGWFENGTSKELLKNQVHYSGGVLTNVTPSPKPEDNAYFVPGIGWFEKGTNKDLWQDPAYKNVYPGGTLNNVTTSPSEQVVETLAEIRNLPVLYAAAKSTRNFNPATYSEAVKNMQNMLDELNYFKGTPSEGKEGDGYFGKDTLNALIRFQLQNGWVWDDLFDNGVYIGYDRNTEKTLFESISAKFSKFRYYKGEGSYKPANDIVIYDNTVYKQLVNKTTIEKIFQETGHFQAGNVTNEMVTDLNRVLYKYGITTTEQIQYFLGVAMHESRNGLTQNGDTSKYRGAGYIQITSARNYEAFGLYIGDRDGIMNAADPAKYIEDNWAWEASGWWWSTENANMNSKIAGWQNQYSDNYQVFYRISKVVNYWNVNDSREPQGMSERWNRYNDVCRVYY